MNNGIMFNTRRIVLFVLGYLLASTAQGKDFIHAFEYSKYELLKFRNSEGVESYKHFFSGPDGVVAVIVMEHNAPNNLTESYRQLAKGLKWPDNIDTEYELLSFMGSRGWELISEHIMQDTQYSDNPPGVRKTWIFKRISPLKADMEQ